jgi:CRISPR/Cas system-associated endonuclease Cas1
MVRDKDKERDLALAQKTVRRIIRNRIKKEERPCSHREEEEEEEEDATHVSHQNNSDKRRNLL